jgi:protein-S-isoprenylcysteine O-methyltransferase Ste14
MALMFEGVFQCGVIVATFVAFYAIDFCLMRRHDRARREGSGRSWGWVLFAAIAAGVLALQPLLLPEVGLHTASAWGALGQMLGLVLIAGGLALHWWARQHLKGFYSERMEIQEGHCLVKDGPYAYVRHPIYTSFFLCAVGLLLVNPALTTALLAAYFFWDFGRTARNEESLLRANLAGYDDYMAETPAYLPNVRALAKR